MKVLVNLAVTAILSFVSVTAAAQDSAVKADQADRSIDLLSEPDAANYKITSRSNLVFLPTRVQSTKGETIYGLKPEQFVVEDNGVRRSVQIEEDPDSSGLSLVVAIQCSRSADKEFSKLKGLGAMIEGIVGDAPHEVAVLSYGEGPYLLGDFSGDSDAVRSALSKLKGCGDYHAVTIDTVEYAINMLKRRQNHFRRAILLISEARDHGSRSRLRDVVAELGVADTVIYTVVFSPMKNEFIRSLRYGDPDFLPPTAPKPAAPEDSSSSPPLEEPLYVEHPPHLLVPAELMFIVNALRRTTALEIASLSGGEYIHFTTQKGFEEGLQRISNQIHNYYLLSFKPAPTSQLGVHSLRVGIPDYPDAVIQTRKSYWSGILDSAAGEIQKSK